MQRLEQAQFMHSVNTKTTDRRTRAERLSTALDLAGKHSIKAARHRPLRIGTGLLRAAPTPTTRQDTASRRGITTRGLTHAGTRCKESRCGIITLSRRQPPLTECWFPPAPASGNHTGHLTHRRRAPLSPSWPEEGQPEPILSNWEVRSAASLRSVPLGD